MTDYVLRLFVSGRTASAATAIRNLEQICAEDLANRYRIEVIDVVDDPSEASAAQVLATPTLVKCLPPPLCRLIGDLSDHERVLIGLEVVPAPGGARPGDQEP